MQTFTFDQAQELALVERSGFVESRHAGVAVVLSPSGEIIYELGNASAPIFARSALKPLQTIASMNAGAELQGAQIALASGSHHGSFEHMKVAQSILEEAGLNADSLQCPAAYPHETESLHALIRAGHGKQRLAFNCSGKHAAFLWACVKSGWDTDSYLSPEHPLQELVVRTISDFAGEPVAHLGVDGCGAPLTAISTLGLARAYSQLGAGIENIRADARVATVATAMVDYPEYVQAPGAANTVMIEELGAVVKGGAEGVLAVGLRGGAAVVVKVLDGSSRPLPPIATELLLRAGFISDSVAQRVLERTMRPVTGADRPVGSIRLGAAFEALEPVG